MPPRIYSTDDGFPKPLQYLHPGIQKATFSDQFYQPHVFQQSVTLTASMWNEVSGRKSKESKENMDWNFDNWRILGKYSPLFIGLACGFGIVILIMSTVMLWRYCLVFASKKVCCKGMYGEITQQQKPLPVRKEVVDKQIETENYGNKLSAMERSLPSLQRSATMASMSWHNAVKLPEVKKSLHHGISTNDITSQLHSPTSPTSPSEPLMSSDLYTSHLYLQKLEIRSLETPKNLSISTPALEELYAKVNFSKKRKNRMRKSEAAIIAMSKSHSGQNNNSLELFGSAVVVYNERTAL